MPESCGTKRDFIDVHLQVDMSQGAPSSVECRGVTIDASTASGELNLESHIKVDFLDTPVNSDNDKKDYRVIKLPNGLTALLISDVQSLCGDDENDENERGEKEKEEKVAIDSSNGNVDSTENELFKKDEKMAGCGLSIGVENFSDSTEIPELSHILEHMVFMESEKYPEENDDFTFITKHGGCANAWTADECTTFYFGIQEKHRSTLQSERKS